MLLTFPLVSYIYRYISLSISLILALYEELESSWDLYMKPIREPGQMSLSNVIPYTKSQFCTFIWGLVEAFYSLSINDILWAWNFSDFENLQYPPPKSPKEYVY